MTNRDKTEMQQVRRIVADYVEANGVTNVRDIAEAVSSEIGFTPSTATVSAILQELGYRPDRQPQFVWRHNQPK